MYVREEQNEVTIISKALLPGDSCV